MEEVSRKDDLREDVPKAETLVEKRSPEERSLKQNSLENGNQEKRAQKEGSWSLPASAEVHNGEEVFREGNPSPRVPKRRDSQDS